MDRTAKLIALSAALIAAACLLLWVHPPGFLQRGFRADPALDATLRSVTDDFRRIIVLMDGAESLDDALRARCTAAGRQVFWRKQHAMEELSRKLTGPRNQNAVRQFIQYLTNGSGLHDADRLAFLDLVEELDAGPRNDVPGIKALRDNLQSIQLAYREEVTRIFSQFATRGGSAGREKWEAYVRFLRERLNREKILGEFGAPAAEPE